MFNLTGGCPLWMSGNMLKSPTKNETSNSYVTRKSMVGCSLEWIVAAYKKILNYPIESFIWAHTSLVVIIIFPLKLLLYGHNLVSRSKYKNPWFPATKLIVHWLVQQHQIAQLTTLVLFTLSSGRPTYVLVFEKKYRIKQRGSFKCSLKQQFCEC